MTPSEHLDLVADFFRDIRAQAAELEASLAWDGASEILIEMIADYRRIFGLAAQVVGGGTEQAGDAR